MSTMSMDHGFLPLSSLRLIVPPLQLVSAALWGIVKQGAVMYYGLLEEFVSTVLETVPELLTYTERVQLVMGLRAKVVLELCRNDGFASPQAVQPHLSRINAYITNQDKETSSSEVEASVTNFLELVHTLVDDQCQRDIFYQKIFPTVFGPKYDAALQALMRKFLFNLQNLLPVPNLEQVRALQKIILG
ncbi:TERF1-interacting nuclear factor 2-like isoform X3 [Chaetodon trifascialis]|uniref:TERF1-interacting nuclear factor 2-like isoform X3 n=1 Tax=Chaetodon trifascialis TaxID=109706 RepID=UPI003995983C